MNDLLILLRIQDHEIRLGQGSYLPVRGEKAAFERLRKKELLYKASETGSQYVLTNKGDQLADTVCGIFKTLTT